MKSIYASKLYLTSSRKDRIKAALMAPGNLALVQQLADSLDEEYQTPENLGQVVEKPKTESSDSDLDNLLVDEDIDPNNDLVKVDDLAGGGISHSSSSSHSGGPSLQDNGSEGPEGESGPDLDKEDSSNLMPESPANEQAPAEASTKIVSTTIADLSLLKDTLNSRQDTAGVIRVAEKENEVWIYYNDDTNLSNIMTDIIDRLIANGYEQFEFNRLARSDNAIVFEIMHYNI